MNAFDPLDPVCFGNLEVEGGRIAAITADWLAGRDLSWKGSYLSHWPVRTGFLESRRWFGEAVLTGADVLAGRRFEDEITLAALPMEIRENAKGPKLRFPENNRPCGIPAGVSQASWRGSVVCRRSSLPFSGS